MLLPNLYHSRTRGVGLGDRGSGHPPGKSQVAIGILVRASIEKQLAPSNCFLREVRTKNVVDKKQKKNVFGPPLSPSRKVLDPPMHFISQDLHNEQIYQSGHTSIFFICCIQLILAWSQPMAWYSHLFLLYRLGTSA